jgi:hypothetical protein
MAKDRKDGADRVKPDEATAGSKPGEVGGVGVETERPDLEQKIDESRGPGERTGDRS